MVAATHIGPSPAVLGSSGGLLPWLAAVWRSIRQAAAAPSATKEEKELFHLLELASSRLGSQLLAVETLDELDDTIDELIEAPDLMLYNVLITRLVKHMDQPEPPAIDAFTKVVESVMGEAQSRALTAAAPVLDAWMRCQHDAMALFDADALDTERVPSLTDPDIAPELAAAAVHGMRASLAMMAMLRAVIEGTSVSPWLGHALVERLIAGVRGHLRLLASLPGIEVSEEIVPKDERLDLEVIRQRHHRARIAAHRSLDDARARLAR